MARFADGRMVATGSGGSNRIRTAILQVLVNLIDFAQDAGTAVMAPRLHFEDGLANLEDGFDRAARKAVAGLSDKVIDWPSHSFFFGGVHSVTRSAEGRLAAAGDPRRQGTAVTV
jgi:gamma-glutamyltranspeptidase/glutathione hydrolase